MFWLAEQLGRVVLILGGALMAWRIFCHVFCAIDDYFRT